MRPSGEMSPPLISAGAGKLSTSSSVRIVPGLCGAGERTTKEAPVSLALRPLLTK